jgi:hypothetical protein
MKYSEILRAVRTKIENHQSLFVCCTISEITNNREHPLRLWVTGLMGTQCHYYPLDTWLDCMHGIKAPNSLDYEQYGDYQKAEKEFYAKMRATRVAWVTWMIEYWEKEEAKHGG